MSGLTHDGVARRGEPHELRDVLAWAGEPHSFPRHLIDRLPSLLDAAVGQLRQARNPPQALAFATKLAIDCAAKLVREMGPRFWESHRTTFRVGVHVDESIVSVTSTKHIGPQLPFTADGPLIPIAARLASRARRGEALVSEDALRVAEISLDGCERVLFEPDLTVAEAPAVAGVSVPENVLKGVTRPVAAWVVAPESKGPTM
jgi:class 3 adenylate cyclase